MHRSVRVRARRPSAGECAEGELIGALERRVAPEDAADAAGRGRVAGASVLRRATTKGRRMPRQLPQGHATRATMAVRRAKACGRGEELAGPGGEEDRLAGCSECWDEDVLHHWDQLLSGLRWVRHRKLTLAVFSRRPQGEFTDSLEISASTGHSGPERRAFNLGNDERLRLSEAEPFEKLGDQSAVDDGDDGSSSATHSSSSARKVCHTAYATPAAAMMPAPIARYVPTPGPFFGATAAAAFGEMRSTARRTRASLAMSPIE